MPRFGFVAAEIKMTLDPSAEAGAAVLKSLPFDPVIGSRDENDVTRRGPAAGQPHHERLRDQQRCEDARRMTDPFRRRSHERSISYPIGLDNEASRRRGSRDESRLIDGLD